MITWAVEGENVWLVAVQFEQQTATFLFEILHQEFLKCYKDVCFCDKRMKIYAQTSFPKLNNLLSLFVQRYSFYYPFNKVACAQNNQVICFFLCLQLMKKEELYRSVWAADTHGGGALQTDVSNGADIRCLIWFSGRVAAPLSW